MKIILRIITNALAIFLDAQIIPDFVFHGNLVNLIIAGLILGILNSLVKPVLTLISFPLILLTFGFFHLIINIAILILAANLIPQLLILSIWGAIWGVVIISLVNYLISSLDQK